MERLLEINVKPPVELAKTCGNIGIVEESIKGVLKVGYVEQKGEMKTPIRKKGEGALIDIVEQGLLHTSFGARPGLVS